MIVCEKYKVVFSNIAKCASGSVKRYFVNQKIDHLTLSYRKFEEYKNYFSFTFVRNPWERMVSIYTNKILSPHKLDPKTGVDICFTRFGKAFYPDMTFIQFIKAVIDLDQTQLDPHIEPQYVRTCSPNTCDVILTFIGRLENSDNDWRYICKNSGMPFSALLNVNKINRNHYSLYYNSEIKDMVSKYWEKDINLFEYSFEDKK